MKLVEVSVRVIMSDDDYSLLKEDDVKEGYKQYTYGTAFAIHDVELHPIEEGKYVDTTIHNHDTSYCEYCVNRGTNEI
jgi:hypothetical protein